MGALETEVISGWHWRAGGDWLSGQNGPRVIDARAF
jgi:hypothetical protein